MLIILFISFCFSLSTFFWYCSESKDSVVLLIILSTACFILALLSNKNISLYIFNLFISSLLLISILSFKTALKSLISFSNLSKSFPKRLVWNCSSFSLKFLALKEYPISPHTLIGFGFPSFASLPSFVDLSEFFIDFWVAFIFIELLLWLWVIFWVFASVWFLSRVLTRDFLTPVARLLVAEVIDALAIEPPLVTYGEAIGVPVFGGKVLVFSWLLLSLVNNSSISSFWSSSLLSSLTSKIFFFFFFLFNFIFFSNFLLTFLSLLSSTSKWFLTLSKLFWTCFLLSISGSISSPKISYFPIWLLSKNCLNLGSINLLLTSFKLFTISARFLFSISLTLFSKYSILIKAGEKLSCFKGNVFNCVFINPWLSKCLYWSIVIGFNSIAFDLEKSTRWDMGILFVISFGT